MMKKPGKSIFDLIIILYFILHLIYGSYMLTHNLSYGTLWLILALIELVIWLMAKKSKIVKMVIVVFLILQSILSLAIMFMGNDKDSANADYVLVLGYQLSNDQMSLTLKYRLDEAVEYAKNNPQSIIVLCGGITRDNTISEAEVMEEYLLSANVDKRRIVLEDKSTDTIENIQNSIKYIEKESKVVVISSNYHVFRASLICQKLGLEVIRHKAKAPIGLVINQLLFEKIGLIKVILM